MNEETLFELARNTPQAERAGLFDQHCAGNPALRARVEALLAADATEHSSSDPAPLRTPDATATFGNRESTNTFHPTSKDPEAGAILAGKYRLNERIGEGGMGSVWLAQQSEPVKRKVAVKLIKAGMDSKAVLARFEAERQALAVMDHPNIAKVLDGGLHDGRPFFVMELVKGVPITEYCDARKLTPQQRLELFVPVCQAIQHAHQKGIIHRDIKPSNVLIALYDDRPVPKVIDFGIAKATGAALSEQTIETAFGGVVGTPQYMSPEQASLNNLDIDTRSDVYSLGVLLYELLTGSPPFSRKELEKKGLLEILRVVREEEPPRPSTKLSTADALPSLSANRSTEPKKLTGLLRNELDWIVMKALEKDRSRRYDTANGFAADVNRYLSGEAVLAHPPSAGYRLRKAYRRNIAAVWVSTAFTLLILSAALISGYLAIRATNAERKAEDERDIAREAETKETAQRELAQKKAEEAIAARDNARRTHYAAQMNLAYQAGMETDGPACVKLLEELIPKPGETDLRGPEWYYWMRLFHSEVRVVPIPELARAWKVEFNRTGTHFAYSVPTNDRPDEPKKAVLRIHSLPEGRLVREITTPQLAEKTAEGLQRSHVVGLSDDGRRILVCTSRHLAVYDAVTGKEVYSESNKIYSVPSSPFNTQSGVVLSGDGRRLCFYMSQPLLPKDHPDWAPNSRKRLFRSIELETGKIVEREGSSLLESFIVSHDGSRLAYATDSEVVVLKTESGEVQQRLKIPTLIDAKIGSSISPLLFANQNFTRLALVLRPMVLTTAELTGAQCIIHSWRVPTGELRSTLRADGMVDRSLSYREEPVVGRPAVNAAPWNKLAKPGLPVINPYTGKTIQTIRHTAESIVTCADDAGHVFGLSEQGLHVWRIQQEYRDEDDPRGASLRSTNADKSLFLDMTRDAERFAYFSYQHNDQSEPAPLQGRLTVASGERGPILATIPVTDDQVADLKFRQSNVGFAPDGKSLMGVSSRLSNAKDKGSMVSRLWRWDLQTNRLKEFGDTWPTAGVSSTAIASTYPYEQWREDRVGQRVAAVTTRPKPSGGFEYALAILQSSDGKQVATTDYFDGELFSPKWSLDGKSLIAFIEDRKAGWLTFVEFDAITFRTKSKVQHEGVIQKDDWYWQQVGANIVFGRDPIRAQNGTYWSSLTVRDAVTGLERATIRETGMSIVSFTVSPDGTAVAVGYAPTNIEKEATRQLSAFKGGILKLYSLVEAREFISVPVDALSANLRPFFNPDGNRLLFWKYGRDSSRNNRALAIYDSISGRFLAEIPVEGNHVSANGSVAWSASGSKMVVDYRVRPDDIVVGAKMGLRVIEAGPLPESKK